MSGADAEPSKAGEKKPTEQKKGKEEKEKKEAIVKELPSGLKIKEAKIGTGPMAKKNQTIAMRYIGKLANGKVFDVLRYLASSCSPLRSLLNSFSLL